MSIYAGTTKLLILEKVREEINSMDVLKFQKNVYGR
jgi:hypothetical protein